MLNALASGSVRFLLCHGALKLDHDCFVCNFSSLNLPSTYIELSPDVP